MVTRVVVGALLLAFALAGTAAAEVPKPVNPALLETYGKLPLSFEANDGQADPQVKFLSRGRGYTLFLTSTEAVLVLREGESVRNVVRRLPAAKRERGKAIRGTVLRMTFVGANPAPAVAGVGELPGKSNYFVGNDPKKWRANVPTYAKVEYRDVYPGVNLVYYGTQRQLEHDFVVSPGADPKAITLAFEGVDGVAIDALGDLVLRADGGEVRLRKPVVYQEQNGQRAVIPTRYVLKAERRVAFEVAAYDTTQPLIIDPVLAYSTYLGGSADDQGLAIAVDAQGNAYVTGDTGSADFLQGDPFPTTLGAFRTTPAGIFVTKLSADGSALVYSSYLGAAGSDFVSGIAVDAAGNAYVTGFTDSGNAFRLDAPFPTTPNAFQKIPGGSGDAFVTKLNATGSALIYSTFLGGDGFDDGFAIAVDPNCSINCSAYVTGQTFSPNFPTTAGAFQTDLRGFEDAFVTKLDPTGSTLIYSTYLGGSLGGSGGDFEEGFAIAVDAAGSAYVTGSTNSRNFPTTPGAFQTIFGGCGTCDFPSADAFVTKLNAIGTALVYSTFLGGSDDDLGFGIAVDAAGNAYVTGATASGNFPATPGAFQTSFGGSFDAFVTKLNATGSALVYSTYLGGSGDDFGAGIAVDAAGNTYVTGATASADFPVTVGAFQPGFGGSFDAFATKLDTTKTGSDSLVYSTFLGGTGLDDGFAIAVDAAGNAYVTGDTNSPDFPTTLGAFQTTLSPSLTEGFKSDAFVAKYLAAEFTPSGSNVKVTPADSASSATLRTPVALTFSSVSRAGTTTLTTSTTGPPSPAGFKPGSPPTYFDISTTAAFSASVSVCINYTGITFSALTTTAGLLRLIHFTGTGPVDVTTSLDRTAAVICGLVNSFSPFAIFEAESTNHPPQAICKNVTVTTDPKGCTAASAPVNNASFDPDAGDAITLTQAPSGPYTKGTTSVTLTATDSHGAADSCTATVTVVDQEAPSISCPAPQIVECTGPGGATATFSAAASDNCGIPSTSCPASGSTFPLGTTSVSCSATDGSGNSNSCNSSVTVRDTTAPTVYCVPVPRMKKSHRDKDRDDEREKFKRGLFQVSASDICSAYTITLGGTVLGDGEIIKITPTARPGIRLVARDDDDDDRGPGIRRFRVGPGEAVITATDAAGNIGSVACPVPQRQGDNDDDDRHDSTEK